MSSLVFMVGVVVLGVAILGAAFIITGSLGGRPERAEGDSTPAMEQPPLSYFTEFDTADYLGVSLKELDYMRENGLLEGSFIGITSLEKTGEEEYYDFVDGIEVIKTRPVISNITRYIFSRDLLDKKMAALIGDGQAINTTEKRNIADKKSDADKTKTDETERVL